MGVAELNTRLSGRPAETFENRECNQVATLTALGSSGVERGHGRVSVSGSVWQGCDDRDEQMCYRKVQDNNMVIYTSGRILKGS